MPAQVLSVLCPTSSEAVSSLAARPSSAIPVRGCCVQQCSTEWVFRSASAPQLCSVSVEPLALRLPGPWLRCMTVIRVPRPAVPNTAV